MSQSHNANSKKPKKSKTVILEPIPTGFKSANRASVCTNGEGAPTSVGSQQHTDNAWAATQRNSGEQNTAVANPINQQQRISAGGCLQLPTNSLYQSNHQRSSIKAAPVSRNQIVPRNERTNSNNSKHTNNNASGKAKNISNF